MLLTILFCSTALHAESLSTQTELELVQEKLLHLNRETAAYKAEYKASLEEQQKQLGLLASSVDKRQLELNKHLTALAQADTNQRERARQMEKAVGKLGDLLTALTTEVTQQNGLLLDQAEKIDALEGSLNAIRADLVTQETNTEQAFIDLRTRFAEDQAQMVEARLQMDMLAQDEGNQRKQIGYWGAAALLILVITLNIGIILRMR
jgi:chromosome segregation ATPase